MEEDDWEVTTEVDLAPLPPPIPARALHVTPEIVPADKVETVRRCRECGSVLHRMANWHPPVDAEMAWEQAVQHGLSCIVTGADAHQPWSFCSRFGIAWVGEERIDYERRKLVPPMWDGVDRRRLISGA